MPPLEITLKAYNTTNCHVPSHPVLKNLSHNAPPSTMESSNRSAGSCLVPRSCTPWSKSAYFPFTTPKTTTTTRSRTTILSPMSQIRRVQFVSFVTVHQELHITDYSKEEMENTWYSKREIRKMKQKCKEEATQITANTYENEQMRKHDEGPLSDLSNKYEEPTTTVRGLEGKTTMGSLRKKRHRIQAWAAVFMEQKRQTLAGYCDPESLADAYFEVSEPCHVVANMVAIQDAREVQSMDEWDAKIELEKENQRGIMTSGSSGEVRHCGRRYQRLLALQNRSQRHLPVMVMSAA